MARLSVAILFRAAISGAIGLRCYQGQFVGEADNSGVPVECMDGALTCAASTDLETKASTAFCLMNKCMKDYKETDQEVCKTVDTMKHCCCYGDGCNGAFIGIKATSLDSEAPADSEGENSEHCNDAKEKGEQSELADEEAEADE